MFRIRHGLTEQEHRLSDKINIDSVRVLDKQIKEQEEAVRKLKRVRNSLLNIHRLPPEVLGEIFYWNVTPKVDFDGLQKESHNFLRVCHHWFEVALRTPEIWSFWGDTLKDWERWRHYSGTAPLDLIYDSDNDCDRIDGALLDALKVRANQNTIRRIHLGSQDPKFLGKLISSLTPDRGGTPSNQIESFILRYQNNPSVDLSDFLARCHFPKLRRLEIASCKVSWNHLMSRTGALTNIILVGISPAPTISQLLHTFASNVALRKIGLCHLTTREEDNGAQPFRVALHHLQYLELRGHLHPVVKLLDRLDYPVTTTRLCIALLGFMPPDAPQTIGPYLRNHLQRRGWSQNGLGLTLSCKNILTLGVGDIRGIDRGAVKMDEVVTFTINPDWVPSRQLRTAALELIKHLPSENVTYLRVHNNYVAIGDVSTRLPNLKTLYLTPKWTPAFFSKLDRGGNEEMFPSLQNLIFRKRVLGNDCWGPLVTFLASRVSSGKRLHTLKIFCRDKIRPEVEKSIKGMVEVFEVVLKR